MGVSYCCPGQKNWIIMQINSAHFSQVIFIFYLSLVTFCFACLLTVFSIYFFRNPVCWVKKHSNDILSSVGHTRRSVKLGNFYSSVDSINTILVWLKWSKWREKVNTTWNCRFIQRSVWMVGSKTSEGQSCNCTSHVTGFFLFKIAK